MVVLCHLLSKQHILYIFDFLFDFFSHYFKGPYMFKDIFQRSSDMKQLTPAKYLD